MKSIIVAALVLMGSSAMADTTVLSCSIVDSQNVTLNVVLADDQSVDFVMVNLVHAKNGQVQFFSQMDKGSVAAQLQQGYLNLLALTDKSASDDGVIVNTGFLGLGAEADGTFGGFLAANGNIYPLTCKR